MVSMIAIAFKLKKANNISSKTFFFNLNFLCLSFFLNKVVDIEQGTNSQVDPLGGRNSDFFYVVQYDVLKIQSLIVVVVAHSLECGSLYGISFFLKFGINIVSCFLSLS